MLRHTLLPAAAVFIVLATQPAAADTCTFESSESGTFSSGANGAGTFEIQDFSFDIEQTLNIGSQTGGSGAGKVTFNPFQITKKVDSATPLLFQSAISGAAFHTIRCSFYGPNTSKPYLTATLSEAVISKFKVEGNADGTPRAKFWFQYEKVEWQY
jgi:type VI secretion system secreted protein Hcp